VANAAAVQPDTDVDIDTLIPSLAALHACRWNDESLRDIGFLVPLTKERAEFLGALGSTATEQFISRFGSRLDPNDMVTLREVSEVLVNWQLSRPAPFSLVHGDFPTGQPHVPAVRP